MGLDLSSVLERLPGLLAAQPSDTDDVEDRILDGALDRVHAFGFANTTMDDIARAAHVGRMTVYRRFGTKEAVFTRLMRRELRRHVTQVSEAALAGDTPQDQLVEAFTATVTIIMHHPFMAQLRATDRNLVFDLASAKDPDLYAMALTLTTLVTQRWRDDGGIELRVTPGELAEVLVRLALSYVIAPARSDDAGDALRRLARNVLVPMALGRT